MESNDVTDAPFFETLIDRLDDIQAMHINSRDLESLIIKLSHDVHPLVIADAANLRGLKKIATMARRLARREMGRE